MMFLIPNFSVPNSEAEARQMQQSMREKLILHNQFGAINLIAGIDCGYDINRNLAHASIAVLDINSLQPVEKVAAFAPADFPYISGLLSFREIPAILAALAKLQSTPDLLMVDGQGIAHPRRMGIASHLGVLLDYPSIGVAKSRLTGNFAPVGLVKGDFSPLMAGSEHIGTVLRSKERTNPLFISPGHKIDVETSFAITLQCFTRYRLPEPTRIADKLSKLKYQQSLTS
jgi:deoxyribonuclease V